MLILCLTGSVYLISKFFCAAATCPPPDFPERGIYVPEEAEYATGMEIKYICNGGMPLYDENNDLTPQNMVVTCRSSGKWSERTPICDIPTKLKNPIEAYRSDSKEFNITDGKVSTCYRTQSDTEEILNILLDGEVIPYLVIMCFGEGRGLFQMKSSTNDYCLYDTNKYKNNCVKEPLSVSQHKTRNITVQVLTGTNSSISLCKIEVFAKDDEWCKHAPDNSVPNGQLEVSRNKAILHCNKGFKEKNGSHVYATCKNNKWSYQSLQCVEAKLEKDRKKFDCPPPDFPEMGNYEPKKFEYEAGMTVTYACQGGLPLFVKDVWIGQHKVVTCQSNGKWSEGTPFCGMPTKLQFKNLTASSRSPTEIDFNTNSCFGIPNGTQEILEYSFGRKVALYHLLVCYWQGRSTFKVKISETKGRTFNEDFGKQQIGCMHDAYLNNDEKTENMTIQVFPDKGSSISLCEVAAFVKDDDWCEFPPISVPNGHLEVGRKKAVLHCNEGFKEKDDRQVYATCQNNTWSYLGLYCVGTYCDPVVGNVSSSEGEWKSDGDNNKILGTTRTLMCESGYHSDGEPTTVICLETGIWTRTSAICKKDDEPQADYKNFAIVVGLVTVIGILTLIGLTIFLMRRKKSTGSYLKFKPRGNDSFSSPPFDHNESL